MQTCIQVLNDSNFFRDLHMVSIQFTLTILLYFFSMFFTCDFLTVSVRFPFDFLMISRWCSFLLGLPCWLYPNYFLHIVVDFPGIFVFPCDYDRFYRVECQQRNEFD